MHFKGHSGLRLNRQTAKWSSLRGNQSCPARVIHTPLWIVSGVLFLSTFPGREHRQPHDHCKEAFPHPSVSPTAFCNCWTHLYSPNSLRSRHSKYKSFSLHQRPPWLWGAGYQKREHSSSSEDRSKQLEGEASLGCLSEEEPRECWRSSSQEEDPFQHCCQPGQSEVMGFTRLVSWPLLNTPLSFVTPFCSGTFHDLNPFYLHDQMYLLYEPGLRMTVCGRRGTRRNRPPVL